jgi:LmbE family N-acetylglucosaminyl deacetylase
MRLKDDESIRKPYSHIYVSPHMDDAVLSCGGRITMQIERGERVLVATAFTEAGDGKRSSKRLNAPASALSQRQKEEEEALGRLGADFILLGYRDGLFRQRLPLLRYGLHLRAPARFASLLGALLSDLEKICTAAACHNLYLPLGIGQHIDHHLVFLTGEDMSRKGIDVSFYEDIPYGLIPHALHYRFRAIGIPTAIAPTRTSPSILGKIMSIHRAVSRIPTLTGNRSLRKGVVLIGLAAAILYLDAAAGFSRGVAAPRLIPEIVDVTSFFEKKLAAIQDYRSQAPLFFVSRDAFRRSLGQYSLDMGGAAGHYLERYWRATGESQKTE